MKKKRIAYRQLAITGYLFGLFMGAVIFPLLFDINHQFWCVLQTVITLCLAVIGLAVIDGIVFDEEKT